MINSSDIKPGVVVRSTDYKHINIIYSVIGNRVEYISICGSEHEWDFINTIETKYELVPDMPQWIRIGIDVTKNGEVKKIKKVMPNNKIMFSDGTEDEILNLKKYRLIKKRCNVCTKQRLR